MINALAPEARHKVARVSTERSAVRNPWNRQTELFEPHRGDRMAGVGLILSPFSGLSDLRE